MTRGRQRSLGFDPPTISRRDGEGSPCNAECRTAQSPPQHHNGDVTHSSRLQGLVRRVLSVRVAQLTPSPPNCRRSWWARIVHAVVCPAIPGWAARLGTRAEEVTRNGTTQPLKVKKCRKKTFTRSPYSHHSTRQHDTTRGSTGARSGRPEANVNWKLSLLGAGIRVLPLQRFHDQALANRLR